jgi:hypothetical protein
MRDYVPVVGRGKNAESGYQFEQMLSGATWRIDPDVIHGRFIQPTRSISIHHIYSEPDQQNYRPEVRIFSRCRLHSKTLKTTTFDVKVTISLTILKHQQG